LSSKFKKYIKFDSVINARDKIVVFIRCTMKKVSTLNKY